MRLATETIIRSFVISLACCISLLSFLEAEEGKADKQKVKEKQDPAVKGEPAANPLRNLIRRAFGANPQAPKAPIIRKVPAQPNPMEKNGKTPAEQPRAEARDAVDVRAPHEPGQARLLRRAQAHVEQKDWKQALPIISFLLDPPVAAGTNKPVDDSLVRLPSGEWQSIRLQANRLLNQFPREELNGYRLESNGKASRLLEQGRREGDLRLVADVAQRYFHTKAGAAAADELGGIHFDRGEFALATRWFDELWEAGEEITQGAGWRTRAAFAHRQAGNVNRAAEIIRGRPGMTKLEEVTFTGTRMASLDWLNSIKPLAAGPKPDLDNWPMFLGNPAHTAAVRGGSPLLLPRWSKATTQSRPVLEKIEELVQDHADQRLPVIPTLHPIMLDRYVIFRSLRGVQVVDAATGELLWETREGVSPEEILTGRNPDAEGGGAGMPGGGINVGSSYYGGENNPLSNLLFRDAVYGVVNSDGARQLFVVEELAVMTANTGGYYGGNTPEKNDPYQRSWSTNRITSYDIHTGRSLWTIGGPRRNEPFDLPLAGTYFFGAPVHDRDELFIVGERDNEIRLFVLDAKTGEPSWSQLLGYVDAKIERDLNRRGWIAQPAVSQGVIVCPTTVGWLVGVDRMSRGLLWAFRYAPVQPGANSLQEERAKGRFGENGTALTPFHSLNAEWNASAPIISGGRVIYTPKESSDLICLDLVSGKQIWSNRRGQGRYVGGVFDGKVLLVGNQAAQAVSLENGSLVWEQKFDESAGAPSGMGVAVQNHFLIPFRSGQLLTLQISDGKVVEKLQLSDPAGSLGNLAMYRGMLLSYTPSGLTAFEQRDAIEAEITTRKRANPHDPWALLRQAEIQLLRGEVDLALASVNAIRGVDVDTNLQPRYRQVKIESLTRVIRKNLGARESEIEELRKFVESAGSNDEERKSLRRLAAEWHDARGEQIKAFQQYLALLDGDSNSQVQRTENSAIQVSTRRWLAGKLLDLYANSKPDQQKSLDEEIIARARHIAESTAATVATSLPQAEQFVELFGFHRAAWPIRRRLIESTMARGNLNQAEQMLLSLQQHSDAGESTYARERLARMYSENGKIRDAAIGYRQLVEVPADLKNEAGISYRQIAETWLASQAGRAASASPQSPWGDVDLKITRVGTDYSSSQVTSVSLEGDVLPSLFQLGLDIDQQTAKLWIHDYSRPGSPAQIPLRTHPRNQNQRAAVAWVSGHRMFLVHRDILHAISLFDRTVEWTLPLDSRNIGPYYRASQRIRQQAMYIGGQGSPYRFTVASQMNQLGMLAAVRPGFFCVHGRREFSVHDSKTGDVLWNKSNVELRSILIATDDVVLVASPTGGAVEAYRALDGKPLAVAPSAAKQITSTVSTVGNRLVTLTHETTPSFFGISRSNTYLRLLEPLTGKIEWQYPLANGARISPLEDGRFVVILPDRSIHLADPIRKEIKKFSVLPVDTMRGTNEIFTQTDGERLYFGVNSSRGARVYSSYYSDDLTGYRLQGDLIAFDLSNGKHLWSQPVAGYNVLSQCLAGSPVVLASLRTYQQQNGMGFWTMKLLALDKQTGRRLIDSNVPSPNGFRSVSIDPVAKFIELRSYNERLRLVAFSKVPEKPIEAPRPRESQDRIGAAAERTGTGERGRGIGAGSKLPVGATQIK